jgi:hypothetical protein
MLQNIGDYLYIKLDLVTQSVSARDLNLKRHVILRGTKNDDIYLRPAIVVYITCARSRCTV